MAAMTQITPFVPVSNLDRTIAFFENAIGFACTYRAHDPDYAFLKRDQIAIRLVQADDSLDMNTETAQQLIYIDVDDIDGLYSDLETGLAQLPANRVRAPFDQPYGQREFHVRDPDITLILFGQLIAKQQGNGPE